MVETQRALFQVQVHRASVHATAFGKPRLGITPEPFDLVDVAAGMNKISDSLIDPPMYRVTQVDKSIVGAPPVAVDDAIQTDFNLNNDWEGVSGHVWHNPGIALSYRPYGCRTRLFCPVLAVRERLWPAELQWRTH